MKKSLKTLAMWLIIGIIFIVSISAIMDNKENKMTYSELMVEIQNGKVENIEIDSEGTKAYVTLKNNSKLEKEVNIPSLDSFMDKVSPYLIEGSLSLEHEAQSTILAVLTLLSPIGIGIILLIFMFLIMGNSRKFIRK